MRCNPASPASGRFNLKAVRESMGLGGGREGQLGTSGSTAGVHMGEAGTLCGMLGSMVGILGSGMPSLLKCTSGLVRPA